MVSASKFHHQVREFDVFAKLSDAKLQSIVERATSLSFERGDAVFRQDDNADAFFVLVHGRLKVSQLTPEGQQIVVRMINPGDLFGIAKAIGKTHYPGTATAVVESVALKWPSAMWGGFLDDNPRIAVNTLQLVGSRLQEAHTQIREMATEEVERRVAHTVLRLIQQSGKKEEAGIRIDFPISRQDIAEMSGTTMHTVSRILGAWETARLVQGGRQKLLVRDAHQLMLIADGKVSGHL